MKAFFLAVLVLASWVCAPPPALAMDFHDITPCSDPTTQAARSRELQSLRAADQEDRKEIGAHPDRPWPEGRMREIALRDLARRKRVAEIFAEGCFRDAADYAAAATVYQHGTHPDHFFLAFVWSRRGVELGDPGQKRMMALALDRYLVNTGRRQLFGSQASKASGSACWCLYPVERAFPDSKRAELTGKTLAGAFDWLGQLNGGGDCPSAECAMELAPVPEGAVPGFW